MNQVITPPAPVAIAPDYAAIAAEVHARRSKTPPLLQPIDKAWLKDLTTHYLALVRETGFVHVRIADVMERSGFTLDRIAEGKGRIVQLWMLGIVHNLSFGDWSLSDDRTRAWGVWLYTGESAPMLLMAMKPSAAVEERRAA